MADADAEAARVEVEVGAAGGAPDRAISGDSGTPPLSGSSRMPMAAAAVEGLPPRRASRRASTRSARAITT